MVVQITHFIALIMLNITSLNVNGLRTQTKINSILTKIKSDILCRQETRWDQACHNYAAKQWDGQIFSNFGTIKSFGVAVLCKTGAISNTEI